MLGAAAILLEFFLESQRCCLVSSVCFRYWVLISSAYLFRFFDQQCPSDWNLLYPKGGHSLIYGKTVSLPSSRLQLLQCLLTVPCYCGCYSISISSSSQKVIIWRNLLSYISVYCRPIFCHIEF